MAESIYRGYGRKYHWPEIQLNIWLLVVLTASASCLGIFAWFMSVQTQMLLGTPWYVPHSIPIPFHYTPFPLPTTSTYLTQKPGM